MREGWGGGCVGKPWFHYSNNQITSHDQKREATVKLLFKMLDTLFFVIQYRTFVAKLTVIGARNGALKSCFRYTHWWSLFLNSTFASIELRPHGHMAMVSFRTQTDITCPDRWIQVMCHYRVLIGVPIKFLNRRETVGNNLAPSGSRKYERTSERANERTSEQVNEPTSRRPIEEKSKRTS